MNPDERYLNAAYNGNWEEMDTILTMYPDVSCKEADQSAIRGGHVVLVKNLIRKKKHSMSISDMCLYAAKVGNVDIIQFMIEREELTMTLVSKMVIMASTTDI
jgi:hypothetical protein